MSCQFATSPRCGECSLTKDWFALHRIVNATMSRCGHHGPDKARCVLPLKHSGTCHEGPGFDEWGPKHREWTS